MSYDVDLSIDTGGESRAVVCHVGNMTSNVSGMWAKALGFPLADLEGRIAGDCIADLERGVAAIHEPSERQAYLGMEPSNGWGSWEGAAKYLQGILDACRSHPKTIVEISR